LSNARERRRIFQKKKKETVGGEGGENFNRKERKIANGLINYYKLNFLFSSIIFDLLLECERKRGGELLRKEGGGGWEQVSKCRPNFSTFLIFRWKKRRKGEKGEEKKRSNRFGACFILFNFSIISPSLIKEGEKRREKEGITPGQLTNSILPLKLPTEEHL